MASVSIKEIGKLLISSGKNFSENNSPRLAGALAFNTIFSLPPLLLLIIKLAGYFFGEEAMSGELYNQTRQVIGKDAAEGIQMILKNESMAGGGTLSTIISVGTLIFAATTFFVTLQASINTVWNIKVKPENGFFKLAKDRILSFGMILGIALLMLVSFVISAAISFLSGYIKDMFPGIGFYLAYVVHFIVSLVIISLLFGLIYRFLPDAIIRWRDTLAGAIATAFLFVVGKFLIGIYLGQSDIGSTYGAAGSIILILVWVYYSSLIIFYGAELTQQYATKYGNKIRPKEHAVFVEEREVRDTEANAAYNQKTGRPPSEGNYYSN